MGNATYDPAKLSALAVSAARLIAPVFVRNHWTYGGHDAAVVPSQGVLEAWLYKRLTEFSRLPEITESRTGRVRFIRETRYGPDEDERIVVALEVGELDQEPDDDLAAGDLLPRTGAELPHRWEGTD